jgi:hypothetical protein
MLFILNALLILANDGYVIDFTVGQSFGEPQGPRHHPEDAYLRWGQQSGYVNFCGQKVLRW